MITLTFAKLALLVFIFLIVEAFFSGSEIALLSFDRLTLKAQAKKGHTGAAMALELAMHPERILSTTLFITSVCVVCCSSLISLYFILNHIDHPGLGAILATSPLIVLLGELLPKTVFQRRADRLAPWVAYPVHWAFWVFYPATRLLSYYTTRLSRVVGPIEELLSGKRKSTREDIRSLLSYPRSETEIKASEKAMIRRIFDFRYVEAKHALIPLVQVDALEENETVQDALVHFERHQHSRMPVYSERVDNIIGMLDGADLLAATDLNLAVKSFLTPIPYVPETQLLEDLLLEMRRSHHEMFIVVDEHGGAVGILTFEDIVEEIVGEISDEFDFDSLPYKELSEGRWSVQARMEIAQINEVLRLELPEGDYETLSGFLLKQFGRIPESRDELFFDTKAGSFKFVIQKATERHIENVLIEKIESV